MKACSGASLPILVFASTVSLIYYHAQKARLFSTLDATVGLCAMILSWLALLWCMDVITINWE